MILLDGKKLRDIVAGQLHDEAADLLAQGESTSPQLAILQVGDLPDSTAFIAQKKLFAEKIGAKVLHKTYPIKVSDETLIEDIKHLNADEKVHGIILQLPVPDVLNKQKIIDTILPEKDVDGLTATNIKRLWSNDEQAILPGTVRGVLSLLAHYEIPLDGKKVTVVGRSMLVGKPLALALLAQNATVTLCHRHTKDLNESTRAADILVVAAGSIGLIKKENVRKEQVVVDVGINFADSTDLKPENEIPKKKMVGDVDFEGVKNIVEAISPVPGGVGPMTVASLFQNLVEAWKRQLEK